MMAAFRTGAQKDGEQPGFQRNRRVPGGRDWDLLRGLPGERPRADRNIAAVPLPDNDPIAGPGGPLKQIWKHSMSRK